MTPTTGSITVNGGAPVIFDNTIEKLVVDGQGGGDTLTVVDDVGGANNDVFTLTPGSAVDRGSLQTNTRQPLRFEDLGETGTVTLTGGGGSDTAIYNGTTANDAFVVAAGTGVVTLTSTPGTYVPVTPNVENLRLNGLAGDDSFTINFLQPYTSILVNGGEPSASDVLNLNSPAPAVVNFFAPTLPMPAAAIVQGFAVPVTIQGFNGGVNPIGVVGVEHVNIDGNGGGGVTVNGSALDDTITYTPTLTDGVADEGIFSNEGFNTVFTFNRISRAFIINGLADTGDHVVVKGTDNSDFITVDSPNRRVTVENAAGTALKAVDLGATVEEVTALARMGTDTILVIPAPATATGPGGAPAERWCRSTC